MNQPSMIQQALAAEEQGISVDWKATAFRIDQVAGQQIQELQKEIQELKNAKDQPADS